ncbi:hypothetical protein [Alkalilimnicola ehrlichii]|uniref:hypothetical protein n=1 Tax=Alkalilimnicola ehrlichii TaxID=351052 RepID=UPI003BA22028
MTDSIAPQVWPAGPRGRDDDLFHEDPRPLCATFLWADIVYLTGSGEFWLLNATAAAAMHHAADKLADIAAVDDRDERNRRLSEEAGVLDSFLPAHPVSFLGEADRQRFAQTLQQLAALQDEAPDTLLQRVVDGVPFQGTTSVSTSQSWSGDHSMPSAVPTQCPEPARIHESNDHLDALQALYQRGLDKAEKAGYVVDSALVHGDSEARIREALQRYHRRRELAFQGARSHLEQGQGLPPTRPLHKILEQYRRHVALCDQDPVPEAVERCEIASVIEHYIPQLEQDYRHYIDSLIELAGLGVATPELALAEDPDAGFADGVDYLARYFATLDELDALREDVDARLREWEQGTGRATPLPIFLFTDEQARFDRLRERMDRLYRTARRRVDHTRPRRVLHWHLGSDDIREPEPYRPRPIHRLVRADFPLREFSGPGRPRTLDHLSLHQLGETRPHYARQRDAAIAHDSRAVTEPRSLPDTALTGWLTRRGCRRLEWNPDWHSEPLGLFEPERFFEDLDRQDLVIDSLADDSAREEWGRRLRRVLFADPLNHPMRLFDASGPAQLLRLLASAYAEPDRRDRALSGEAPLWLRRPESLAETNPEPPASGNGARIGLTARYQDTAGIDTGGNAGGRTVSVAPSLALDELGITATVAHGQHGSPVVLRLRGQHAFDFGRGEIALAPIQLPDPAKAEPVIVPFGLEADHPDARSIGRYCLHIEPVLHGHAAVSVALGGGVGLDTAGGRLAVNGLAPVERDGVDARLEAFAGTGLAGHNHCRLLWQPPANLLARLPRYQAMAEIDRAGYARDEARQWKTLTAAEINPEVRVGVGGEAAFRLGLHNGRFVLHASLRLVLGVGGGGSVRLALETRHLDLWLAMMHQALVEVGYERVDWIDEDAFEAMSRLAYLAAITLVEPGLLLLRGTHRLRQMIEWLTRERDMASRIAYTIVNDPQRDAIAAWVRQLPPEALGPLLYTLTSRPQAFEVEIQRDGQKQVQRFGREQALVFHQRAILNCLQWIVSGVMAGVYGPRRDFSAEHPHPAQKLFEKAVVRMARDGQPTDESRADAYAENRGRLDNFMSAGSGQLEQQDRQWKYRQNAGWLSRHIQ